MTFSLQYIFLPYIINPHPLLLETNVQSLLAFLTDAKIHRIALLILLLATHLVPFGSLLLQLLTFLSTTIVTGL